MKNSEIVTVDYKNYRIYYDEDTNLWKCLFLNIIKDSLKGVKKIIDKL